MMNPNTGGKMYGGKWLAAGSLTKGIDVVAFSKTKKNSSEWRSIESRTFTFQKNVLFASMKAL